MKLPIRNASKSESLRENILLSIMNEKLKEGDQILSENTLAKMYSVSAPTVHNVMKGLAEEGILKRIKGKGTFVNRLPLNPETEDCRDICMILPKKNLDDPVHNPNAWHILRSIYKTLLELLGENQSLSTLVASSENSTGETLGKIKPGSTVICLGCKHYNELFEVIAEKFNSVIIYGEWTKDYSGKCLHVTTDLKKNAYLSTCHLAAHGYRKIAFVGSGHSVAKEKKKGYMEALKEAGIKYDPDIVIDDVPYHKDLAPRLSAKFREGMKCDAIFADTDQMAAETIRILDTMKIRVPEDIAIAGYDALDEYIGYPTCLTTVRIPYEKIFRTILKEEEKARKKGIRLSGKICFQGELVVGRSCGCKY